MREASRRYSALYTTRTDNNQRVTMNAGSSKLACRASSREIASAVARSSVPRESRLILGGHYWHVAPRPRAEGERPLASAVPCSAHEADHSQRSTARTRSSKLACCASPRKIASAVARSRVPRESRLILGGHRWQVVQQPRADGQRSLAGAASLPSAHGSTTTRVSRCTQAASSRAAPPPERQRA